MNTPENTTPKKDSVPEKKPKNGNVIPLSEHVAKKIIDSSGEDGFRFSKEELNPD